MGSVKAERSLLMRRGRGGEAGASGAGAAVECDVCLASWSPVVLKREAVGVVVRSGWREGCREGCREGWWLEPNAGMQLGSCWVVVCGAVICPHCGIRSRSESYCTVDASTCPLHSPLTLPTLHTPHSTPHMAAHAHSESALLTSSASIAH